jgi:large subunit ribosomal protein L30
MTKNNTKKIKITLIKSAIDHIAVQKATIKALGIHRLHESVVHADTPIIRGMINTIFHLVKVEEV